MIGLGFAILIVEAVVDGGGLGDQSVSVTFLNDTTERVTVYPYGRNYEAAKRILGPGEKAADNLLASGGDGTHVADVEAFDDGGILVFCHNYTKGEVQRLGGVVRITLGHNDCR